MKSYIPMSGPTHREVISWSALAEAIKANPQRGARLLGTNTTKATASASIAAMPAAEVTLSWLPGWKEDTAFSVSDAVSLFLWISDPLYRVAVAGVRRTMEMEVAGTLLASIEKEWKAKHGRHRGWVRKHLEEDLRGRSSGADPAPDFWELVRTNKRAALLLDYVCVVRNFRVALWWPDHKSVTTVPLMGVSPSAGVININCESGHVLLSATSVGGWRTSATEWSAVVAAAKELTWIAPMCSPSAGAQTVAQIQEKLTEVGAPSTAGGGKAAMWQRYLWQTLLNSLTGKEPSVSVSPPDSASD